MSWVSSLITAIGGRCCHHTEEQVYYCIKVKKLVRDLDLAKKGLAAKITGVEDMMKVAEVRGETSTQEAKTWIEIAAELVKKAETIERSYDKMCTCLGSCTPNCWSRNRIGEKASETLKDVEKHKKEGFPEVARMLLPVAVQEIPMESVAIGMDLYFSTVIGYLRDGSVESERVRIIGILGIGGVGKTTLLRGVNNDFLPENGKEKKVFDHVIYVEVSVESKLQKLQEQIANRIGVSPQGEATVASYAQEIFRLLKNRSFLLLLDDLREVLDLRALGIPHPRGASPNTLRQNVVFSTRSSSVCRNMGAHKTIKMKGLEHQTASLLFRQRAGEEIINSDKRIPSLADEIVKECHGLPRALIDTGVVMSSKTSFESWRYAAKVLKSQPLDLPGMDHPMIPILKYSYDGLEDDIARKCFLSCVLWPPNFSIGKDELIECWIGLGLIDEGSFPDINLAYDRGHFLIDSLKEAGLLEPESRSQVRLPNRLRGFALWVAYGCGNNVYKWIVRAGAELLEAPGEAEEWGIAEQMSLMHNKIAALPQQPLSCPNLQTLVLKGNHPLKMIPHCFFQGMPALRYLDLSHTGIEELPREIGSLVELRYLNLSCTRITSLPDELASLVKLKHLLLYQTSQLKTIPQRLLSELKKLCVLDLTGSGYAYYWEGRENGRPSISELECLRREGFRSLGITIVSLEALRWLSRLSSVPTTRLWLIKLEGLVGSLELLSRDHLGSPNMQFSLKELTMMDSTSLEELEMVAGGGSSLMSLEILRLVHLDNLSKISWNRLNPWSSLPCLRELTINRCGKLKHITWVLELQCLEYLNLRDCNEMEQISETQNGTGAEVNTSDGALPAFPSLRRLVLDKLSMLENICDRVFAFPCLESLHVSGCPQLKKLPFIDTGELRVISCEIGWWEGLEWEDNKIKSSLASYVRNILPLPVDNPPISAAAAPPPPPSTPLPHPLPLVRDIFILGKCFLSEVVLPISFPFFFFILCTVLPPPVVLCCILVLSIAIWERGCRTEASATEDEEDPIRQLGDVLAWLQDLVPRQCV